MQALENKIVLVVGGSSGIGFLIAKTAIDNGANVIIASRSKDKLEAAITKLNSERARSIVVNMMDDESVNNLLSLIDKIDHLQIPASEIIFEPFASIALETAKQSFESKFWGPFNLIKKVVPYINETGSITLFSGLSGQKPDKGSEVLTAINSAVDGFARALAISLSPVRVNSISPGLIDTPAYQVFDEEVKKEIFDKFSENLLIKRWGLADEVASTAMYLMTNNYVTGTTQLIDGGRGVL